MAQTEILMLQLDAFCEHTMQKNAIAAGVRWGSLHLQCFPRPLAGFKAPEIGAINQLHISGAVLSTCVSRKCGNGFGWDQILASIRKRNYSKPASDVHVTEMMTFTCSVNNTIIVNKKLSYCWETVRRESMPRIAEMDVEMTT